MFYIKGEKCMKYVLLLLALILIGYVLRKIEIRYRQSQKEKRSTQHKISNTQEKLKQLKQLKKYDENGYEEETYERIVAFHEKVNKEIETCFTDVSAAKVEGLQQEFEVLSNEIQNGIKQKENDIAFLTKKKEYIMHYLDSTNFYPHYFALDNNKLSGMILEMEEQKKSNPVVSHDDYVKFGEELYEQVIEFQEQHKVVVGILEKMENQKEEYPANKKKRIMEMKNELFLSLHNGKIKEVKKYTKELRSLLK